MNFEVLEEKWYERYHNHNYSLFEEFIKNVSLNDFRIYVKKENKVSDLNLPMSSVIPFIVFVNVFKVHCDWENKKELFLNVFDSEYITGYIPPKNQEIRYHPNFPEEFKFK